MTGGAEINFGGAREVYLCEFEKGTGAREIYPSQDQMNKVKTKDSKRFFGRIGNSSGFSGRKQVISKKRKKGLLSKNVDLHSSSPVPVISSGHSPGLGGKIFVWGGTSSHLGEHGPGMPPVAPGLTLSILIKPLRGILLQTRHRGLPDFNFCWQL